MYANACMLSASRVLFARFVCSKCITVLKVGCSLPVNLRPSDRTGRLSMSDRAE